MKSFQRILLLAPLIMLAGGLAAQEKSDRVDTAPHRRLTLPADAKRIDALTHSYTDKDGKAWIYRQTPFGLVRYRDESGSGVAQTAGQPNEAPSSAGSEAPRSGGIAAPVPAKPAASGLASPNTPSPSPPARGLRAIDEGDSVRFERDGPFGKYTWVRKKGQLTAQEQAAWEAAQKSGPAEEKSK